MPRGGLSQDPEKRARQLAGLRKGQEALAERLQDPDYRPSARQPAPTPTEAITTAPEGDVHVISYPEPAAMPAPVHPHEEAPHEPEAHPEPDPHPEPKRRRGGFFDGFRGGI